MVNNVFFFQNAEKYFRAGYVKDDRKGHAHCMLGT